jgi:DNA-binding CsgD family transcriptional regulator
VQGLIAGSPQSRSFDEGADRERELDVIGAFVNGLAVRGGTLLLSGDPGVGKSALLDAAAEKAVLAGIRVLRAAGVESDDMSFGVLNELLFPLRSDLEQLDDVPRNALNVALGFSDGPGSDRLRVSNAALELLNRAAADQPLMLVVDNLQWVDEVSGLVLGFIARRLRQTQVGLVAAERTGASRLAALDGSGCQVRLIDDEADRTRRLAIAAHRTASVTGDLGTAEALLADARRACPGAEPSAENAIATAFVVLHGDGDVATAHRLLLRGLETVDHGAAGPLNAERALEILVTVCRLSGRADHWESLRRLIAASGSAAAASAHADVGGALDPGTASGRSGEAESLVATAEPTQIVRMATASARADRLADCRQALRRAARPEPDGSTSLPAVQAGILLAVEAYQTGQWDDAWRLAESAADQCAARGYQLLHRQAQTVLAVVAACRGAAEAGRTLADEIARWAAPRGITSVVAGARYASALAALGQSDFQTAYQQAAGISGAGSIPAHEPFAAWALLDLVEAALRTDRRDEAVAHVKAAEQAGLAATSPRMALLAAATTAMIAPDDDAPALFELALTSEDAQRWPFDRARVQLLFGERLRRARAAGTARVHLAAALEEFRRLGAPTWADRAATALRAAGQVPPGAGHRGHQVLTAHELEIARLAAAGLSNKEIGGRLFMSHRTVASHLYRMFPKLGITSRAALGRVLPPDES